MLAWVQGKFLLIMSRTKFFQSQMFLHASPTAKLLCSCLLVQPHAATTQLILTLGGARRTSTKPNSNTMVQENWYPGHMQKAVRDMQGRLKQVDLILEIRDARVPLSACSSVMEGLLRDKRRIVVLNKADLVPKRDLKLALRSFASKNYLRTLAVSANDPESVKRLMRASLNIISTERASADESLLMVVGLPNAGKSSIINGLKAAAARTKLLDGQSAYNKRAKTGPLPGVTRNLGSFQLSKQPRVFVLDTPGVLPPAIQDPLAALNIALTGGMPVTVTDSAMMVRHLIWLLLQRPHQHMHFIQQHLAANVPNQGSEEGLQRATAPGAGAITDPEPQEQQQQEPRQPRTRRRLQRIQPDQYMPDQQQQPQPRVSTLQPFLPLHKACSSVAKALIEALGMPQQLAPGQLNTQQGSIKPQPTDAAFQLQHLKLQHPQQGLATAGSQLNSDQGASQGTEVPSLDEPVDDVHARMHHLIVLLSRASRQGVRGWGAVTHEVSQVPVSAAQRQDACDRVLWAFRRGELGRLMLDNPVQENAS